MKTDEMIQIAALGAIGFLLWQKFGTAQGKAPATKPTTSTLPVTTPVDFGVTNPDDSTWDTGSQGIDFVQKIIADAML